MQFIRKPQNGRASGAAGKGINRAVHIQNRGHIACPENCSQCKLDISALPIFCAGCCRLLFPSLKIKFNEEGEGVIGRRDTWYGVGNRGFKLSERAVGRLGTKFFT